MVGVVMRCFVLDTAFDVPFMNLLYGTLVLGREYLSLEITPFTFFDVWVSLYASRLIQGLKLTTQQTLRWPLDLERLVTTGFLICNLIEQ